MFNLHSVIYMFNICSIPVSFNSISSKYCALDFHAATALMNFNVLKTSSDTFSEAVLHEAPENKKNHLEVSD